MKLTSSLLVGPNVIISKHPWYCSIHKKQEGREIYSAVFGGQTLHLYRGRNGLLHMCTWRLTITNGGCMGYAQETSHGHSTILAIIRKNQVSFLISFCKEMLSNPFWPIWPDICQSCNQALTFTTTINFSHKAYFG